MGGLMLATKFQETLAKLQADAVARQQALAQRDAFIQAQFPVLDAAFSAMVSRVCGSHPRLAVIKTAVTDTVTNHTFTTLSKTVIEVRSTLYGPLEVVTFTPALEAIAPDQFAVIRATTAGLTVTGEGFASALKSLLDRGVLMRGKTSAGLVLAKGDGFEPLTDALLESFLAALFIRTS